MEMMMFVFGLSTLINVVIAMKINSRLNQVTELLDQLDELVDEEPNFDDLVDDGIKDACCVNDSLLEDEELIELEKRIETLERNTVTLIEDLSNLQASIGGLSRHINEVAEFTDRLAGKVDQLSNR